MVHQYKKILNECMTPISTKRKYYFELWKGWGCSPWHRWCTNFPLLLKTHAGVIFWCSCTQKLVPLVKQHSMAVVFGSLHFKRDDATLASGWAGPTFQLDNISLFLKQAGSIVCLPLSLLITLAYLVSHHPTRLPPYACFVVMKYQILLYALPGTSQSVVRSRSGMIDV